VRRKTCATTVGKKEGDRHIEEAEKRGERSAHRELPLTSRPAAVR
jgi:hypothetical protein